MRDLVRLSEEELHELTTAQRLRIFAAVGISMACGIVSLQSMAALLTDTIVVPLPGLQHSGGQVAWGAGLAAMLLGVTFLVRGVIKRRLQWAIALSLLIHFLLCLSMSTVDFRGRSTHRVQALESSDVPREEFSMPDYAEASDSDPVWEQPADSPTPENEIQPDRPEMQISEAEKTEAEDVTQSTEPKPVETPERQETVELAADTAAEMEKQSQENAVSDHPVVLEPDVAAAAQAADPTLESDLELARVEASVPESKRLVEEVAAASIEMEAARLEVQRAEAPALPGQIETAPAERTTPAASRTESVIENISVATSQAAAMSLREQATDASRERSQLAAATERTVPELEASIPEPSISSKTPLRSRREVRESQSAPADGGAVSMARAAARTLNSSDSAISTENADVVAAGSGAELAIIESRAAAAGERMNVAKVPDGLLVAGDNGSASPEQLPSPGPATGLKAPRASSVGVIQPRVGDPGSAFPNRPRSAGRPAMAAGASVNSTDVAATRSSAEADSDAILGSAPKISVARQGGGLPSANRPSGIEAANGVSGDVAASTAAESGSMRSVVGAVAGARGTEPSAKLSAEEGMAAGGAPRIAALGARSSSSGLPNGAATAEQSGTLVFAGPQAMATVATAVAPRTGSLPRRSAGLPGTGRAAGEKTASSSASPSTNVSSVTPRIAVNRSEGGVGSDRPSLASAEALSGLVKRRAQSRGSDPAARIPETLSMRSENARRDAARSLGGSEASEESVERGLQWLARNQYPDGHWSIDDFPGENVPGIGEGSFQSNTAATGLSLLAFLGAGYTHESGRHQEVVSRGMKWLLDRQKPDGDLFADETEFVWFYSHGIASIAICEAYGLTRDAALKRPSQQALDFIVASQHPEFGGWRYRPQFESDTSVSGWQLMALKSGEMAGLKVSHDAYDKVGKWLDSVQSKSAFGQFGYHPTREASAAMTAEGLLMRQYLGAKRDDAELIAGANYLRTRLPDFGQRDAYYWYYGTQFMFHMQGEHWSEWNKSLRDMLVTTQGKGGTTEGSWDPTRPSPEKWASAGGRHYLTCLNLLMLEVYYRHLPLYLELEK